MEQDATWADAPALGCAQCEWGHHHIQPLAWHKHRPKGQQHPEGKERIPLCPAQPRGSQVIVSTALQFQCPPSGHISAMGSALGSACDPDPQQKGTALSILLVATCPLV